MESQADAVEISIGPTTLETGVSESGQKLRKEKHGSKELPKPRPRSPLGLPYKIRKRIYDQVKSDYIITIDGYKHPRGSNQSRSKNHRNVLPRYTLASLELEELKTTERNRRMSLVLKNCGTRNFLTVRNDG
jgi:hypothetical protein